VLFTCIVAFAPEVQYGRVVKVGGRSGHGQSATIMCAPTERPRRHGGRTTVAQTPTSRTRLRHSRLRLVPRFRLGPRGTDRSACISPGWGSRIFAVSDSSEKLKKARTDLNQQLGATRDGKSPKGPLPFNCQYCIDEP
jgi:hypothetical protein